MSKTERQYEIEIVSEQEVGRHDGFLYLRRLRLRNLRRDGSRSREWLCDIVERPKGVDAVVLVLWRRDPATGAVEVLLRQGLRPAVIYGRRADRLPLPEQRADCFVTELVAGIVEEGEIGEAALRRRAAEEAWEEAGIRINPAQVVLLGAGVFPSPGMTGEKFWFGAAEVAASVMSQPPAGDGSPMEEGAVIEWMPLDEALARCRQGQIEDAKTELGLRRLAEWVSGARRSTPA